MNGHRALVLLLALGLGAPLRAAELFYLDHDRMSGRYVGAVGPLVLSGDIVAGDYDRLLTKIAQDEKRFLEQNTLIVASEQGEAVESLHIARLLKALMVQVTVDPLAGKCVGACFLIYAAASQRAADGPRLLGVEPLSWGEKPPELDAFLEENPVPAALARELHRHEAGIYWLTLQDEQSLGSRSPPFVHYLKAKCSWDEGLEREVFLGKRPFAAMAPLLACRARVTRSDAHRALAEALAVRAPGR